MNNNRNKTTRATAVWRFIRDHEAGLNVRDAPYELTQTAMGEALGMTRSNVAMAIRILRGRGLVVEDVRYVLHPDKSQRLRKVYHTVQGSNGLAMSGGAVLVPVAKMEEITRALQAVDRLLKECRTYGRAQQPQEDTPKRPEQGAD